MDNIGVPVSHLRIFLHDINNELFAVGGNLQLLDMQKGKPEADKTMQTVRQACGELQTVIAELGDYVASVSDGMTHQPSRLDLAQAARSAVTKAAIALKRHGREAQVEATEAVPVNGDPQLVERLVLALIRNALWRGGPSGPVTIRVSAQGDRGVVRVEDHAGTVPSELRERIFTAQGFLDAKKRGMQAGRGSALLFARAATQTMKGGVSVECAEGVNSFVAWLPRG